MQRKRDGKEPIPLKRISEGFGGKSDRGREAKLGVTSASPWPGKLKSLVFSSMLAVDSMATAH